MRLARPFGTTALAAATLLLAVGIASDSAARRFRMSGSWDMRRGGVFLPLRFPPTTSTWPGTGGPPPPFPNGPVLGMGGVTATGSGPATLVVPQHRFGGMFSTRLPLAGITLVQLTTMLVADGPAAAATLAPGGGPGSFTWCPGDPACVVGGGMLSTDPPQGAGARNGRIVYRAGPSQFGGVMRMLLQGSGSTSFLFQVTPFQVGHFRFGPGTGADGGIQHTGGPYATTVMDTQTPGVVTQPLVPPTPSGLITAPGPTIPPTGCSGTAGTPPGVCPCCGPITTHTGFRFTTGTVFVQQTTGSVRDTFFTVMGSDMRTALGAGNITLVAGGLSLRNTRAGSSSSASYGRVRMTLSAPIPSLSPAGFAAATALLLLAAGYALRRRG